MNVKCDKCDDTGEIEMDNPSSPPIKFLCDCETGEALREKRLHDDYSPGDRAIDVARARAEAEWAVVRAEMRVVKARARAKAEERLTNDTVNKEER